MDFTNPGMESISYLLLKTFCQLNVYELCMLLQAKNAFLQERARLAKELKEENDQLEAVIQGLTSLVGENARLRSAAGNPSSLMDQSPEAVQEVLH